MRNNKQYKFDNIYKEWVQPLFRFVYFKTGDKYLAEEITQEIFVGFWDKMDDIDVEKCKSYLFTSAKNKLINRSKHLKVRLKFELQFDKKLISESPQYLLEMKEFHADLEIAISSLPEGQREVFLMHRLEGMKYREIAEVLNIGQKAVEKRMHKALLHLRTVYKKI